MMAAKGAIVPVDQGDDATRTSRSTRRSTCRRSPATTRDSKGNMLSFPFNSSTRRLLRRTRTRSRRRASIPNKAPKTWKEFHAAAEKLKASGPGMRVHHRLAVLDARRELQRLAQRADRHEGKRHGAASTPSSRSTRRCTCATSRCWATWRRRACSPTPAAPTRREAKFASGECAMLTVEHRRAGEHPPQTRSSTGR